LIIANRNLPQKSQMTIIRRMRVVVWRREKLESIYDDVIAVAAYVCE